MSSQVEARRSGVPPVWRQHEGADVRPTQPGASTRGRSVALPGCIILALYGSAALLPLLVVAGRPADNLLVLAAIPATFFLALTSASNTSARLPALIFWGIGLLCAAAVASGLSNRPDDALAALRFASYGCIGAAAIRVPSRQRRFVARGILLISLMVAGSIYLTQLGFLSLPTYADAESTGLRIGGTVGHPNFAAYTLGLTTLCLLAFPAFRPRFWVTTVAVLAGAQLLTGSRGAALWLAVAATVLVRSWWHRSPAILFLAFVAVATAGSLLLQRFDTLATTGGLSGGNAAGWRLIQWQRALDLQPGGVGVTGLGWNHAQDLLPGSLGVHNGYLQVYVELGLLGVLGMALLLVGLLVAAARQGWSSLAIILFYIVPSTMTDPVLLYPASAYLLLAVVLMHWRREWDGGGVAAGRGGTVQGRSEPPVRAGRSRGETQPHAAYGTRKDALRSRFAGSVREVPNVDVPPSPT